MRINKLHGTIVVFSIILATFVSINLFSSRQNFSSQNMESLVFRDESGRIPYETWWGWQLSKVGVADLNGDGFQDLYFSLGGWSSKVKNRIFINDGTGHFIDETKERHPKVKTASFPLAIGDVDNDGDLDILDGTLPHYSGEQDRLYINDGWGYFTDNTKNALPKKRLETSSIAFGDIDNDGDLDIMRGSAGRKWKTPNILVNNGHGIFQYDQSKLPYEEERCINSVVFFDFDYDGDLDIFHTEEDAKRNMLLLNNGFGYFDFAPAKYIPLKKRKSTPLDCKIADFNNDGFVDIIIGYFGRGIRKNQLLINKGNGTFKDKSEWIKQKNAENCSSFFDVGDFDNDGDIDILMSNWSCAEGNWTWYGYGEIGYALYENDGRARFKNVTSKKLPVQYEHYWSCMDIKFIDVENDGDLDIVALMYGLRLLINTTISSN